MTCDRMDIKTIKIMSIRSFVKVYFIDREFVHVIFDHKRSRLSQIINNNSSVFCSCSYLQTIYIFHFRNCSNIPIIIFWRLYKSLKMARLQGHGICAGTYRCKIVREGPNIQPCHLIHQ